MAGPWLTTLALLLGFVGCAGSDAGSDQLRVYVHTDLPRAPDAWTVRVEVAKRAPSSPVNCEGTHDLPPVARSLGGALVLQQAFSQSQKVHVRVTLCRDGQAAYVRSQQLRVEGETRLSVLFSNACAQHACAQQDPGLCTLQDCTEAACGADLPSCRRLLPEACGAASGPTTRAAAGPTDEPTVCEPLACVHGECLAVLPAGPSQDGGAQDAGSQDAGAEDAGSGDGRRCRLADGRSIAAPLYGYTLRSRSEVEDPEVLARLQSQAFTALRLRIDLDGDLWGLRHDFGSLAEVLKLVEGKTLFVQLGTSGTAWRSNFAELDVQGPNYFRDTELASYAAFVQDLLDAIGSGPSQLVLGAFRRPHRRIDADYGEPANARGTWLGRPSFDVPEGVVFTDSAAWSGGLGDRFVALHQTLRDLEPAAILSSNGVDGRITRSDLLGQQEQMWLPAWVSASAMQAQLVDLHLSASDLAGTPEDLVKLVRKSAGEYRIEQGHECYVLGEAPLDRRPSTQAALPPTTEQARVLRELAENLEQDPGFVGMFSSAPPASERGFWESDYVYEPASE